MNEKLLKKIKTLKIVMEAGEPGEKENAQRIYKKLLKKYGITDTELLSNKTKIYWFKYKNRFEEKLIFQIIGKVLNKTEITYIKWKSKRMAFGCEMTNADYINTCEMYEIYRKAFDNEVEILLSAFLQKHKIFSRTNIEKKESENFSKFPTQEEMNRGRKIHGMMQALTEIQINKSLKRGKE